MRRSTDRMPAASTPEGRRRHLIGGQAHPPL
ncbi:MAG: hypothetical protein ACI9U2_004110, partial [Bradymonadia bacterium]